jgi:lactate permease
LGNPIRALVAVTGLPDADLSAMVGRILPWTALVLPFWLVSLHDHVAQDSFRCGGLPGLRRRFRGSAILTGRIIRIPRWWTSLAEWLTLAALALFFRIWKPAQVWHYAHEPAPVLKNPAAHGGADSSRVVPVPVALGVRGRVGIAHYKTGF